jgi:hypothetical protein
MIPVFAIVVGIAADGADIGDESAAATSEAGGRGRSLCKSLATTEETAVMCSVAPSLVVPL